MGVGLVLVALPGSQFKNYIPLAEMANTACLIHLLTVDLGARRKWFTAVALGGAVLGLTAKGRRIDEIRTGTVEAAVRQALGRLSKAKIDAAHQVLREVASDLTPDHEAEALLLGDDPIGPTVKSWNPEPSGLIRPTSQWSWLR